MALRERGLDSQGRNRPRVRDALLARSAPRRAGRRTGTLKRGCDRHDAPRHGDGRAARVTSDDSDCHAGQRLSGGGRTRREPGAAGGQCDRHDPSRGPAVRCSENSWSCLASLCQALRELGGLLGLRRPSYREEQVAPATRRAAPRGESAECERPFWQTGRESDLGLHSPPLLEHHSMHCSVTGGIHGLPAIAPRDHADSRKQRVCQRSRISPEASFAAGGGLLAYSARTPKELGARTAHVH